MQKYTVFNMDDLNGRNLMTVFNSLNENLFEDHMDEPFEYLLAKALIQEILNAKLLLHRVSKVYEVNTSLNQFFSIIKSLQLFEWSEIFTEKQIANTFLYCINNGLGDCFLANKMEGIYSELIDNNENSGSDEESSDSEAENELQSSSALKDQLKKKESLSPQRNSIIPNFTSVIPQNVGSDDCLQSPINNTGRLTLTKKLVSFASHNKSIQISESSSEEINNDEKDELEEEEADLVGDLPTKHGIISPETLILEPDLKNLDNQRKEEKAGSLEIQEKHKLRQRIYDQTNTSFKISLQKSQSLSTIKNRKSSILDFTEMNFGKEKETLDVRTFLPIQEFCTFGVGDLFKNMIESSKKTKKKAEKLVKIIERRNQRMVFDYNMLDIKNEEEIVKLLILLYFFN